MRTLVFLTLTGFILWFIPWVFAFSLGTVVYFPYESDGNSRYVRMTGPLAATIGIDDDWADKTQIPLHCKAALIAAEDGKFLDHSGIDTQSIQKAIERNKRRKIARGGSTITQQLVKNVFLHRKKTYIRKAREIVGAILLDVVMSKSDQLTWYLNVVEFGPRVYGIRSAAKYYYNKSPKSLSLPECASLVALLRDPIRSSRGLRSKVIPSYLQRRQQTIMSSVQRSGIMNRLKELES